MTRFLSSGKNEGGESDGETKNENDDNSKVVFRPRRRMHPDYRPIQPRGVKKRPPMDPRLPLSNEENAEGIFELGGYKSDDPLVQNFGPMTAEAIRHLERIEQHGGVDPTSTEDHLTMADYITAEPGTTEELMGERRGLAMDGLDEKEREEFLNEVDKVINEEWVREMNLGHIEYKDEDIKEEDDGFDVEEEVDENGEPIDPMQMIQGEWYVCLNLACD